MRVRVNTQFFFIEHYDVGLNAIRGTTHYLDVRMIVHVVKNILEKTCLIDLLNFSLWHSEKEFCTYKDTSNFNFSLKIGSDFDN